MKPFNLKKSSTIILLVLMMSYAVPSFAANEFAWGRIQFVQMYADGITISLRGNALSDCLNQRVYILTATHGEKMVDRAYNLGLTALQMNNNFMGIVIDKNINGPNGLCEATSGNLVLKIA